MFCKCPKDFWKLLSDMKFKGYKILSCNQWGVGVFGGADYDGERFLHKLTL